MLGTPLSPWFRAIGLAYTLGRVLLLVGLAAALGGVFVVALTEPAEAPVLTYTPWRP